MNAKRKRHLAAVPAAPPNTCSINIRLSKKAKESNLSLEGMLNDCRALAFRHGLRIVNEWIDEQSGAIRNREGFLGWLADAREGRAAVLIAYHVDRMTREGVNVAALILDVVEGKDAITGAVVRHPVRLLDCKGLDSNESDTAFRLTLVLKAEIAREERERMSDRSLDMHRRFKAEGKATPGSAGAFGFMLNPDDPDARRLIPNPAEAKYLREAAEQVWAIPSAPDDVTFGSVVRWMNGPLGCKPRRAKAWSRTTLRQCLTRTPDCVDVDIFTPDERASLRQILAPAKRTEAPAKPVYRVGTHIASSGLLECASCGSVMHIHPRKRTTGVVVDDYRCSESFQFPGKRGQHVSVFSEFMDSYLEAKFLFDHGDELEYTRRASVTGYAAVEEAELAVADALRALEKDATAKHFAALQLAQIQRAEAEALPQVAEVSIVPTGRTIREAWHAADMAEKQAMLRRVWVKIIVGPGGKGARSLDPNRLTFVGRPPYVTGVHETAAFVPGGMVITTEDEDEAAQRDRLLA